MRELVVAEVGMLVRVVVTSSRRPSRRLRSFIKELAASIPGALRVNRGKSTLDDLLLKCLELGALTLIISYERKGNPSLMKFYEVKRDERTLSPSLYVRVLGVKLRREIPGAIKLYNPTLLGVDVSSVGEELLVLCEKLAMLLGARLVFSEEDALTCDVIIRLRPLPSGEGIALMEFLSPSTGRHVGPSIRIGGFRIVGVSGHEKWGSH